MKSKLFCIFSALAISPLALADQIQCHNSSGEQVLSIRAQEQFPRVNDQFDKLILAAEIEVEGQEPFPLEITATNAGLLVYYSSKQRNSSNRLLLDFHLSAYPEEQKTFNGYFVGNNGITLVDCTYSK